MAKPEKRFRCGGCEAAIFENEISRNGDTVKVKKVSFQKRYKDKDGEWKSTQSLDVNDLPKAILALSSAYEHIVLNDGSSDNGIPEEKV
jgi:hypothetical protein